MAAAALPTSGAPKWFSDWPNSVHTDGNESEALRMSNSYFQRDCFHCGTQSLHVYVCSRCQEQWYCSEKCQKAAWTDGNHRKQCEAVSDAAKVNWRACRALSKKPLLTAFIRLVVALQDEFFETRPEVRWLQIVVAHRFAHGEEDNVMATVCGDPRLQQLSKNQGKVRGIMIAFVDNGKLNSGENWATDAVVNVVPTDHNIAIDAFELMAPDDAPNKILALTPGGLTTTARQRTAMYARRMRDMLLWMYRSSALMAIINFKNNVCLMGPEDPWFEPNRPSDTTVCERMLLYRDQRKIKNPMVIPKPVYIEYSIEPLRLCPNDGTQRGQHDHPEPPRRQQEPPKQ